MSEEKKKCLYCKNDLGSLYFEVIWWQDGTPFRRLFCYHQCMIKFHIENSHSENRLKIKEFLKDG